MKKKNLLIALLIVVALIVWSNNIHRIISGLKQNDENESVSIKTEPQETSPADKQPESKKPFVFEGKFRDPFAHWLKSKTKPKTAQKTPLKAKIKKKQAPKPAKEKIPELRYSGAVRDSLGTLALLEDGSGAVFFAREKDTIKGILISEIALDSINCRYKKEKFTIFLRK